MNFPNISEQKRLLRLQPPPGQVRMPHGNRSEAEEMMHALATVNLVVKDAVNIVRSALEAVRQRTITNSFSRWPSFFWMDSSS